VHWHLPIELVEGLRRVAEREDRSVASAGRMAAKQYIEDREADDRVADR
jgi:hypothetical protein